MEIDRRVLCFKPRVIIIFVIWLANACLIEDRTDFREIIIYGINLIEAIEALIPVFCIKLIFCSGVVGVTRSSYLFCLLGSALGYAMFYDYFFTLVGRL